VSIAEYEGQIAELERKVGQLTMAVDLLKKGARLARQPNGDSYSRGQRPEGFGAALRRRKLSCVIESWRCATSFHAMAIAG
jgi:hypothetical protein